MKFRNLLASATMALGFIFGGPVSAATIIDLGFGIDESGSINNSEFTLQNTGLANALKLIPVPVNPTDPTYRVSIVQFASTASTLVGVTEIKTVADRNGVVAAVQANTQSGGATAIGDAIKLLTDNFLGVSGGLGDTSILNIGTDGSNNSGISVQAGATYASDNEIDALSFEAIGSGAVTSTLVNAAFPGSIVLANNASELPDDVLSTSFVLKVDNFSEYEGALKAKLVKIIDDTGGNVGVVPLPAGMPLMFGVIGAFAFMRRRQMRAA